MNNLSNINPLWIVIFLAAVSTLITIGMWIGAVNSDRKSLKEAVTKIQNDIKKLLQWIPSKTVDSGSPLKLTPVGEKVSKSIDAPLIAKGLVTNMRARTNGKLPYDIQELCFDFIRDEYRPSDEIQKNIKQCAYDNGIDCAEVLDVLAIELRDELLKNQVSS